MASVSPKSLTTHGKGRFVSWPHAPEEVGRGRQIDAEVDAAQLVDAVQPLDPDRRLLEELLRLVLLAEQVVALASSGSSRRMR